MFPQLVLVGAALNLFGTSTYIRDTLRGKTKPNRVTWGLWALSALIGAAAGFSNGVTWAALPVFMAGFCPLMVFISSFVNPHAYWKLEFFDYACGILAIFALLLWVLTKEPVVAIVFAISSDFFAAIPTLRKSWKHPDTESGIAYLVAIGSASSAFAAITTWTFSEYAFPTYLVIIDVALAFTAYRLTILQWFRQAN